MTEPIKEPTDYWFYWVCPAVGLPYIAELTEDGWCGHGYDGFSWSDFVAIAKPIAIEPVAPSSWSQRPWWSGPSPAPALFTAHQPPQPPLVVPPHPSGPQGDVIDTICGRPR